MAVRLPTRRHRTPINTRVSRSDLPPPAAPAPPPRRASSRGRTTGTRRLCIVVQTLQRVDDVVEGYGRLGIGQHPHARKALHRACIRGPCRQDGPLLLLGQIRSLRTSLGCSNIAAGLRTQSRSNSIPLIVGSPLLLSLRDGNRIRFRQWRFKRAGLTKSSPWS